MSEPRRRRRRWQPALLGVWGKAGPLQAPPGVGPSLTLQVIVLHLKPKVALCAPEESEGACACCSVCFVSNKATVFLYTLSSTALCSDEKLEASFVLFPSAGCCRRSSVLLLKYSKSPVALPPLSSSLSLRGRLHLQPAGGRQTQGGRLCPPSAPGQRDDSRPHQAMRAWALPEQGADSDVLALSLSLMHTAFCPLLPSEFLTFSGLTFGAWRKVGAFCKRRQESRSGLLFIRCVFLNPAPPRTSLSSPQQYFLWTSLPHSF